MRLPRQLARLAFSTLLFMAPGTVYSIGIFDAYALALEKDPTYLAALKEKQVGDEIKNIGRAGLFPSVALSYRNSPRNWQTQKYQQSNIFGITSDVTKRQQYRSYASSITLTQPLFDYQAYALYKASVAQTLMADERYRSQFLDLAVRVIGTYIEAAYAKDQITLAMAQKKAYQEQLTLNKRLLSSGEGTVTDVSETSARYSLASALEIEARDNLDVALHDLEAMIGTPLDHLDELQVLRPGRLQMAPLLPADFAGWQKIALQNNPELAAARHSLEAAKYEIERNRAGFMPQVQLYATHSENDSNSDNTINQKYRTDSLGLQVNLPLYAGGRVSASTRQAAARYGQVLHEKDALVNKMLSDLRKQFNVCASSQAKLAAYDLAVKSATTQIKATRKSVQAGQRTNADVLNAEQQLYSARQDLAVAKYTYIKAWVSLLSNSGTLDEKEIYRIAQYFAPPR